jgi:hypothetical protein
MGLDFVEPQCLPDMSCTCFSSALDELPAKVMAVMRVIEANRIFTLSMPQASFLAEAPQTASKHDSE